MATDFVLRGDDLTGVILDIGDDAVVGGIALGEGGTDTGENVGEGEGGVPDRARSGGMGCAGCR